MLVAFLGITLGALYLPLLLDRQHFFMADHCYYFQPFTHYLAERLRQGQLPLWNPYVYCGMSQLAVPSPGIFYPPNLLFVALKYSQALSLILIGHQLIAAVGTFLLIASFGWGAAAAITCALAVALCGYVSSLPTNHTLATTACWLPLLLWSFRAIVLAAESGKRNQMLWLTLLSGMALAMYIGCGRPEVAVPGAALIALVVLWHARAALRYNALKWQLLAIAAAALLSGPIILPTAEWIGVSPRAHGLNMSQVLMWSACWYDWVCMFFIRPFGDLQVLGAQFLPLVTTRSLFLQFVPSNYVGPVVLTLAIWGLCDRNWRWRWLIFTLLAGSVIMCVGEYWPIAPWLVQHIPVLSIFRYPIKWMIFPILFIAVAAARGVCAVRQQAVGPKMELGTAVSWALATLLAVTLIALGQSNHALQWAKPPLPAVPERLLGYSLLLGCMAGLAPCLIQRAIAMRYLRAKAATWIIVGLVALNLLINAFCTFQMTTPEDFFAHQPGMLKYWRQACRDHPGSGRLLALYFDPVFCPGDYRSYPNAPWTPSFYQYTRELLLANTNLCSDVPETFGYEAAETGFYRSLFFDVLHRSQVALSIRKDGSARDVTGDLPLYRFCQSTGTQFISTQVYKGTTDIPKLNSQYFNLLTVDRKLNAQLYELVETLPRAYFTPYWSWIDNATDVALRIINADSTDFDPWLDTCVVKGLQTGETEQRYNPYAPEISSAPATAVSAPADADNTISPAQIMSDQPEHISISVNAKKPGFVVLLDHYYPGWQAFVNGVKRPIYCLNAESRCVYVPAGSHLVEMNYEPKSLKQGLMLAIAGGALLLIIFSLAVAPHAWKALRKISGT